MTPPKRVVDEQKSVGLLLDTVGIPRAQDEMVPALVGLDLVESGLDLPPLVVESGELGRGRLTGIAEGGDQPSDVFASCPLRAYSAGGVERGWQARVRVGYCGLASTRARAGESAIRHGRLTARAAARRPGSGQSREANRRPGLP
nr:hypothetical protein [Streptosporangium nondiastaticum]